MAFEQRERAVERAADEVAHRTVDLSRGLLAELAAREPRRQRAEKALALSLVSSVAQCVVHAVAGDHRAGNLARLREVVGGSGR